MTASAEALHVKSCTRCGANPRAQSHRWCHSCRNEYSREWRKGHRLVGEARSKSNARARANVYQSRGAIERRPCSRCGAEHAEKHHADYSRPLDVTWLCRSCHLAHHRNEVVDGVPMAATIRAISRTGQRGISPRPPHVGRATLKIAGGLGCAPKTTERMIANALEVNLAIAELAADPAYRDYVTRFFAGSDSLRSAHGSPLTLTAGTVCAINRAVNRSSLDFAAWLASRTDEELRVAVVDSKRAIGELQEFVAAGEAEMAKAAK